MESVTRRSNTRRSPLTYLIGTPGFLLSLAVIGFAIQSYLPKQLFTNLAIGLALTAYFLNGARTRWTRDSTSLSSRAVAVSYVALGAVSLLSIAYVQLVFQRWLTTGSMQIYTNLDLLVGGLLIVLVTVVTTDRFGRILGGLVLVTVLYGWAGPYLPWILGHGSLSFQTMIFKNTIALQGVYGFLTQIAATWVAIFVIFAGIVRSFGGFELIVDLAEGLRGRFRGAVPQTAVVSSMFMGTMTGGAGVNVVATGSFTIPLMKEQGIKGRHAGAIESVASTAGQVLPPIMGSAAFIMSDILGVHFATVAIAATIPAFLYYFVTSYGVYQWAITYDWEDDASDVEEAPADEGDQRYLLRGLQFLVPLALLVYLLIFRRYGPLFSGLYTILALFVTRFVYTVVEDGIGVEQVVAYGREVVVGLKEGGESAAPFIALLATLAVVINIFSSTGLSNRITFALTGLTGTSFVGILVISMVIALLFGLGMPTPAAYLLVATIIAPVVVQLGKLHGFAIQPLTAHMFVFYFAMLSALTPPVALAIAMAVTISGSGFLTTAKESLRLGGPTFLIPFVFVFNPELLYWSFPATPISFVVQLVGLVVALSASMGVEFGRRLPVYERVVRAALFLVIAFGPGLLVKGIGIVLFALLFQFRNRVSVAVPTIR